MEIKFISYDGSYPNLCSGTLVVSVNGKQWEIDSLDSGGSVWFSGDYEEEHVESGPWGISDWPEGFPDEAKQAVVEIVNQNVPQGCCGGCI